MSCAILSRGLLLPLLLIPILIYRSILKCCVKLLRPDLSHMLRGQGGFLLHESVHREPALNIVVEFQLEGTPDFDVIKKLASERLVNAKADDDGRRLVYPELQQYCVKWAGYFWWKQEESFNIDEHVQLHKLGPDEDIKMFQRKYLQEPMAENRSPWQAIVVIAQPKQVDTAHTAAASPSPLPSHHILFKCHHSLADAYSLIQILSRMVDPDMGTVFLDPSKYTEKVSAAKRFLRGLTFPARAAIELVRMRSVRTPILPWPRAPTATLAGAPRHFYMGGGDGGGHDAGGSGLIQMEKVKRIAVQYSVTTTAVIYGAVAGALRGHLLSKYSSEDIPSHVNYIQHVPVPNHPPGLCNAMTWVTFRLPIGEPNPTARLKACDQMIQDLKHSLESRIAYCVIQVWRLLPFALHFLRHFDTSTPFYLGTACIAGPLNTCAVNEQLVLGMNFLIAAPVDLHVCMMSYNGVLQWSCTGDTHIFTEADVHAIGEGIGKEFKVFEVNSSATMQQQAEEPHISEIEGLLNI